VSKTSMPSVNVMTGRIIRLRILGYLAIVDRRASFSRCEIILIIGRRGIHLTLAQVDLPVDLSRNDLLDPLLVRQQRIRLFSRLGMTRQKSSLGCCHFGVGNRYRE